MQERLADVGLESLKYNELVGTEQADDEVDHYVHLGQFLGLAVSALQEADYEQAVEIYRLLNKVHRGDVEVRSNLGFCMMATDLYAAIPILAEVCSDEESQSSARALNLALATALVGEYETARVAIEDAREFAARQFEGWMWDLATARTDGRVTTLIYLTSDLRAYLSDLEDLLHDRASESA